MTNYKLTLAYDGSRYDGWQKQGNTDRTIQGRLETLVSRLAGEPTEVYGAGRTDAGVHAKGQVCSFHLRKDWQEDVLRDTINEYLPADIAVLEVEKVPERFHARLWAVGKTYCYRIRTSRVKDVFERNYVYRYGRPLDIQAMREAAEYFIGEHDFKSFCSNKRMKKSTVRRLYDIEIKADADEIRLYFHGEGFLYNMVRILTGTLLEVGAGMRRPDSMPEILAAGDRQAAGVTAPPQGLILCSVYYEKEEIPGYRTGAE